MAQQIIMVFILIHVVNLLQIQSILSAFECCIYHQKHTGYHLTVLQALEQ